MSAMTARVRGARCGVLFMLALSACSTARAEPRHKDSDEQSEVTFLIRERTGGSLATASLLIHLTPAFGDPEAAGSAARAEPTILIQRAVALAADRPELVWLQLRDCQQRRCEDELRIAAHLRALDPDNGFAWLAELRAVPDLTSVEMTRAIEKIGASKNPQLYWNRLVVMMYDALTHHDHAHPATAISWHPDDRLMHVIGILGAVDSPAFQSLGRACHADQFAQPGRRAACTSLMTRLETSDAILSHNFSLTIQESWWSDGSPERLALRQKHLQQRYLTVQSARARESQVDNDAELRVETMRRVPDEEGVEREMLTAFHEPLERPADWAEPPGA